jgi:large subunit ribosomal protein L21
MLQMNYAIAEISGKQIWVEKGKCYDINKIKLEVGSKITLNRILLINEKNNISLGKPYLEKKKVTATILQHFKGTKFVVYKMKPKKKMRRKQGFRKEITRIIIDKI